jgi:ABC-2 type transport system permease protein
VFFTFFFPVIIVVIFGGLVETQSTDGGLFAEPSGWYIAGYLSAVVIFTPLSRVGSEVARHRDGGLFEKLATTPLRRWEWLLAQTLVNTVLIGLASLLLVLLLVVGTGANLPVTPELLFAVPIVGVGVALFCAVGAILGSLGASRARVIAASNGIAIPLLFLSEAFVAREMLPDWLPLAASPVTYFVRGVRGVTYEPAASDGTVLAPWPEPTPYADLLGLCLFAVALFVLAALALPRMD